MGTRVLVVDDSVDSVALVGLMLERKGFEIIAAVSGEQALVKAETEHPDVVILDVMMPDMDGFEVCSRLRANPATAELPVLILTAKTSVKDKVAGFEAGADDYVVKPIHPDELASRLTAIMHRAAARRGVVPESEHTNVIGFLGAKGGVGITTLAINVAAVLAGSAEEGHRVVLAEMRSGLASAALQLGLDHNTGLAELLRHPVESVDASLVDVQLQLHRCGVRVLCGQIDPPGVALPVSPAHAEAILGFLMAETDHLLLDLGSGLDETNRLLLSKCDHVVIGADPDRIATAMGASLLAAFAKSPDVASDHVRTVLVHRARSASSLGKEEAEKILQGDILGVVPAAAELAFRAEAEGMPMVALQPTSVYALQIGSLARQLSVRVVREDQPAR